jgi:ribose transport system substrate-binding protein
MADILHGEGRVVVVTIPGQFNLDERLRGVEEAFKNHPQLRITRILNDEGDPRIAHDQIAELIGTGEKMDGILALEASGGPGAAEVVNRVKTEKTIRIVAMDKNPETLDWISRRVINATIAQKPYTMSFYGLKFLDDLHHNVVQEFKDWQTAPVAPVPSWVDAGTAVVELSNLEEFREQLAQHPREF